MILHGWFFHSKTILPKFAVSVLPDSNCLSLNVIYCRERDYFLSILRETIGELWIKLLEYSHFSPGFVTESVMTPVLPPFHSLSLSVSTLAPRSWAQGTSDALAVFGDGKRGWKGNALFFKTVEQALAQHSAARGRRSTACAFEPYLSTGNREENSWGALMVYNRYW